MKKTFKDAQLQNICLGAAIIVTSTVEGGAAEETVNGGGPEIDPTNT